MENKQTPFKRKNSPNPRAAELEIQKHAQLLSLQRKEKTVLIQPLIVTPIESKELVSSKNSHFLWIIPLILFVSLFSLIGGVATPDLTKTLTIGSIALATNVMYFALLVGLGLIPGFLFLNLVLNPDQEKIQFKRTWSVVWWSLFTILGLPAFMVLTAIFTQYLKMPFIASLYLSSLISLTYEYLILKLFAFNRMESHWIVWEVFRFGLVGIVATLFDLVITTSIRMVLENYSSIGQEYLITFIAVLAGFTVGVIVNYILSITMVYKNNKKQDAKTWWGVLVFVALSAMGLGIGIGMESLFYNYLHWSYILVFIFRTVVVLVWNYLTRKFILFK